MDVRSIISCPISEDTRLNGHQTIRFNPDGFSVLVADASYKPVLLQEHKYHLPLEPGQYPSEAGRILEEIGLLDFSGETVLIYDGGGFTIIPEGFYSEEFARPLLENECIIPETDIVCVRRLRERKSHMLFHCPGSMEEMRERIKGECTIIHTAECLGSLSDQIRASDHQRGFLLADVQEKTLGLLVIRADDIILLNCYRLGDPSYFIYHTLNTMKQLDMDPESIPVYLSGIIHDDHELTGLLKKYIREVKSTPYYLEGLSREDMLKHMVLSEGSKCA